MRRYEVRQTSRSEWTVIDRWTGDVTVAALRTRAAARRYVESLEARDRAPHGFVR